MVHLLHRDPQAGPPGCRPGGLIQRGGLTFPPSTDYNTKDNRTAPDDQHHHRRHPVHHHPPARCPRHPCQPLGKSDQGRQHPRSHPWRSGRQQRHPHEYREQRPGRRGVTVRGVAHRPPPSFVKTAVCRYNGIVMPGGRG